MVFLVIACSGGDIGKLLYSSAKRAQALEQLPKRPSLISQGLLAASTLFRHPAYTFSAIMPVYLKYESARMKHLQLRQLSPVFCAGTFYMYPDPKDPNPGVSSSIVLRGGLYEPETSRVFVQLLRKGATVLDIGANIGWYTLLAAKKITQSGKVIACEPEPHNFQILEQSVKLNRLANVILVEKCVSDRSGQAVLHISDTNAGSHSIVGSNMRSREVVVSSTSIDELCTQLNLQQIDVLKIDAESAEPLIISGARDFFSRGQPESVIMEFSPKAWEGNESLLAILFNQFKVFEIRRRTGALRQVVISDLPDDRQIMLLLLRKNANHYSK